MCNVLNILDILGVKGVQRQYISLRDLLVGAHSGADQSFPVLDIYCNTPFDILFRLSPKDTQVFSVDRQSVLKYNFTIVLHYTTEGDGKHTYLELQIAYEEVYRKDITEYLNNAKRNPYLKLYTNNVTALQISLYVPAIIWQDNQTIAVAQVETIEGLKYLTGSTYYNDTSKELATYITRVFCSQFGTVTDILYMTFGEYKKLYT